MIVSVSDLPPRPYLPVLVRKLAGSMEVRPYFLKYEHRVFKKYGNGNVNNASLLPGKPIVMRSWELSFVDICIFQAISGAEVYGRS